MEPVETDASTMNGRTCPNCGATAPDRFCPTCGQRQADDLVPTLGEWIAETADELLLVEARLPRTIRALFWPPGHLTREWRRGRRASYVTPLRLYLLAAVPFFLGVSVIGSEPRGGMGFFETLMTVGYANAVADIASYEPLQPLPPELTGDSVARARWQAEFEESRREYGDRAAAQDQRIREGLDRFFELLPVVVGLGSSTEIEGIEG